jgi:hypothetical protein
MANTLLRGLLGGAMGLGSGITEISRRKLDKLAERARMEVQEEFDIRSEGRTENRQVAAEKRALSNASELKKMEGGLLKSDISGKRAFEMEKLGEQHKNKLEEIAATGEANAKVVAGKQMAKPETDQERQDRISMLSIALGENGIPVTIGIDGSISAERGLTDDQQKVVQSLANQYGFKIGFGNERKEDQPGLSLLFWKDNPKVKDITGIASTGGLLGGSANTKGDLTIEKAKEYIKKANGNVEKAKELAKKDGYEF